MTFNVAIYPRHAHARRFQAAFCLGLSRHGITYVTGDANRPVKADMAIIWSHHEGAVIRQQKHDGLPYLVMEAGFVGDRLEWCSLGYNGLNGRADYRNANSPPDRWNKYFADVMRPWRDGGAYTLVMGQLPGDFALLNCDIDAWYAEAAACLAAAWHKPVMFRPHPMAVERDQVKDVYGTERLNGSLKEALSSAACVATWNSSSAIDAVLAGVPAIARDRGSMAWDVAAYDYDNCVQPTRDQWAANLAYTQWLEAEIAAGEAWAHLTMRRSLEPN